MSNENWNEQYRQMWNQRYAEVDYAYGKEPNVFFAQWLTQFPPGKILLPADGESRNGVFAAEQGWDVTAVDLSESGKTKAEQLAAERGVSLDYRVGDVATLNFALASFDAIALIFAHFGADKISAIHRQLSSYLRPGGIVILEGYSKNHLPLVQSNPAVGGPRSLEMLFTTEAIREDFADCDPLYAAEEAVELREGRYHIGTGSVVRFVGQKR